LQQLVKALDEGPDVGLAGKVHAEPVWCHYTSLGIRAHGHACLLDPPTTDPQQASVRGVTVGDVIGGARDSRRVQPALSGCRHADRVRLRRRWPCCGLPQRRPGARPHRVRRCSKRVLSRCVHRDRSGSEHNGRRSPLRYYCGHRGDTASFAGSWPSLSARGTFPPTQWPTRQSESVATTLMHGALGSSQRAFTDGSSGGHADRPVCDRHAVRQTYAAEQAGLPFF